MPDLSGLTYDQARKALEDVGLYLEATGTGENGRVFSQTVDPGVPLAIGTAVEVKFAASTQLEPPLDQGDLWPAEEDEETETSPEAEAQPTT